MHSLTIPIPEHATCPGCNADLTDRSVLFILSLAWCGLCPRSEQVGYARAAEWSLWLHSNLLKHHRGAHRGLLFFTPPLKPSQPLLLLPEPERHRYVDPSPVECPIPCGWPP